MLNVGNNSEEGRGSSVNDREIRAVGSHPCEASQFSRVRCDLAETHAASGALVSQLNIDTIFFVRMSVHKPSNQLVLEYGIHVHFI